VEFGVEDGDADAVGGDGVGVGAGNALDEPVQAEPAQVVAHLAGRVVAAEESGDVPAKASVGQAGGGVDDKAQGAGQGHGAMIPEAQRSGSLALLVTGLVGALEQRRPDGTALAGSLDHKQAVVDSPRFGDQLGQVLQAGRDRNIGGLVDDGLDPVGAALRRVGPAGCPADPP